MSHERRRPYPFDHFEPKWQRLWDERATFHAPNPGEPGFDPAKPKYYVLDMFPYPSGTGLHVGHPEGYTATDIIARYKRMRGFNVLHPMGWDAFGLPAEQYAIKTGQHPAVTTAQNVGVFKGQLQRLGFAYDWQREVNTTDPAYYRWTQWIFLQIYNSWFNPETQRAEPISSYARDDRDSVRLAYVTDAPVWWCPALGTVLANEEVVDGKSEVGGHPVERRPMRQWMLRITAYAQRLIDEVEELDWPHGIKALQRNWIGRSEGANVTFSIQDSTSNIPVFTTRPDTLYGATYMVLAPEHPLVDQITTLEQREAIAAYRASVGGKSDLERTDLAKDKSGVATGAFAINPVNGERLPVWIADYVLMGYGTGAIMAVPAHDERDWEFATRFGLPIREVVSASPQLGLGGENPCSAPPLECFTGEGYAINSSILNGLPTADAKATIIAELEKRGLGERRIQYKLRDWLFSRQRYWGEPFPIVWENGQHRALEEHELPLEPPPLDDFRPTGTSEPPLAKARDWVRYSETATRELNTMPQWAGSCWYYLRYCDARNAGRFVGRNAERYWMGGGFTRANATAWSEQLAGLLRCSYPAKGCGVIQARVRYAPVSDAVAEAVLRATGLDVGGYEHSIDAAALRHIFEKHGNPARAALRDEPVVTPADLARLPEIVSSPDEITVQRRGKGGSRRIVLRKQFGEIAVFVEEVRQRDGHLAAVTFWKNSSAMGCPATTKAASTGTSETLHRDWDAIFDSGDRKPGGVDLYVGGTEHAVLHLLYARFWHKVLFDLGHVSTPEPFQRLVNQGLILGEDGQKMSKSRGNVVNPDDVIVQYGADALRCYEMFMGPLEATKPWAMTGVEGIARFLARVWRLVMEENQAGEWVLSTAVQEVPMPKPIAKAVHATIKKVGEDIEELAFNTAISQMMICTNSLVGANPRPLSAIRTLLQVLNPFAPHITEELWERLGAVAGSPGGMLADQPWPEFDPALLVEDEVELPVQVNGKVRDKITVRKEATSAEIEAIALAAPKVVEQIAGKTVRKIVVVPGRLVNIVAA